jgi:integrase
MTVQPRLFDLPAQQTGEACTRGGALDPASEVLLARYRERRLVGGGHPSTVSREASQLRSLTRELGANLPVAAVFRNVATLARVLLEPSGVIAASTGRCRLVAAQRFVRLCSGDAGIEDAERFLAALDRLLPARTRRDWHSAGTIVAGTPSRRRALSPTLEPADLVRIVGAATARTALRARRDRALVALHCYSGLRPDELVRLRWSQVTIDPESEGMSILLRRGVHWLHLLLAGPAVAPLLALRWHAQANVGASAEQYVFRSQIGREQAITNRAAREIVRRACQRAGFPLATATDLRAAFACWLRARGLSDHETAAVLGLHQVRSLDRLLLRHRALDAQRQVREMRPPGSVIG